MKTLVAIHIVQFSFWEYETFDSTLGGTAFIGPNGAGKTSLVDAIQIAIVGGHGQHVHFNAQSVHKDARSICDYALGTMRSGEGDKGVLTRKRDEALSYITLVFKGERQEESVSAGLCIWSTAADKSHKILGLYVLPGVELSLEQHLEDMGCDGKAPMEWSVFEASVKDMCRKAGRTPTVTNKPETYTRELLHNIQSSDQPINAKRFLRALSHSINLKQVSSVGDFLRGYLVEATAIDKQGTLRHIKTLRKLAEQIEDVRQQIVRLHEIGKRYNVVATMHRSRAVATAIRLQLLVEAADAQIGTLEAEIEDIDARLAKALEASQRLDETAAVKQNTYQALYEQYARDPERQDLAAAERMRKVLEHAERQNRRQPESLDEQIRTTLLSLADAFEGARKEDAATVRELHNRWERRAQAGELPTRHDVQEALRVLRDAQQAVRVLARADGQTYEQAVLKTKAAYEKKKAADSGIRIRDDDVAAALTLFSEAGIDCHTVASVVSVSDVQWQGAIESVLGRNRHAIIVTTDRERDAVRLLRRAAIPEVMVVQPAHLTDVMHQRPDAKSVAALLQSGSEVALAFFRRILGRMRQVDTEEELEQYSRALTRDYMLSANGGTKRIRALPTSDWVLGVQITTADRQELREEIQHARNAEREAERQAGLSRKAEADVSTALSRVTVEGYDLALAEFKSAQAQAAAAKDSSAETLNERLAQLKNEVDAAKAEHEAANNAASQAKANITSLEDKRMQKEMDLGSARASFTSRSEEHQTACQDQDYDIDQALSIYDKCAGISERTGPADALKYLDDDVRDSNMRLPGAQSNAVSELVAFINEHSINLIDERSDWRKAAIWVTTRAKTLEESTLTDYRQQAAEAREAAELAFRSDVKYRLREAIQRVDHEIRDLNRMLDACPPFTGGEKYRFVANVSPTHRTLYDLIVEQSDSLFASDEVQNKLVGLMEACEAGNDKGNNPLEDYRLFYNFDLEIRVDGIKVDLLSKRMGVASNGEHRVPFYVIAGAALATAYRIKQGAKHQGAGVMILDEAFYGMDAQNTFVTAEFLKRLGLQLVMAGPDSDIGKLLPVLDGYYDLTRSGPDVFVEHVIVKEPARVLLQSDIPERNPQLVEAKVKHLTLAES